MKILVIYKNIKLDMDFRCDLFIENSIVVELKAVSEIHPMFEAKLLNYMKLLKSPKGILINFNCFNLFREAQTTFVNEYFLKFYPPNNSMFLCGKKKHLWL